MVSIIYPPEKTMTEFGNSLTLSLQFISCLSRAEDCSTLGQTLTASLTAASLYGAVLCFYNSVSTTRNTTRHVGPRRVQNKLSIAMFNVKTFYFDQTFSTLLKKLKAES